MTMAMRAMATGARSMAIASAEGERVKVNLRMENVSKSYGGRKVVDGISMRVQQGEIVGLSGKSIMVGREPPSGGSVCLEPLDITTLSLPHRTRLGIGYLTQESSVFRGLSVLEEKGEFSLQAVEDTMGRALSGGERGRTELARALASNCSGGPPAVLLVDEPLQLQRLCDEDGMGVLITDQETLRICDCAYMVHNGCVLVSGGPEELYQDLDVKKYYYLGEGFQRWVMCQAPSSQ